MSSYEVDAGKETEAQRVVIWSMATHWARTSPASVGFLGDMMGSRTGLSTWARECVSPRERQLGLRPLLTGGRVIFLWDG